jgi:hypothetical protein
MLICRLKKAAMQRRDAPFHLCTSSCAAVHTDLATAACYRRSVHKGLPLPTHCNSRCDHERHCTEVRT